MSFFVTLVILISLAYTSLILIWILGWNRQPIFQVPPQFIPHTKVSVIIPARNESTHIAECIQSIIDNNYPKDLLEIIVIDDHSTDDTYAIAQQFSASHPHVQCIRLADFLPQYKPVNAYKKKAIEAGISVAKGELIITTDADCKAPVAWIRTIVARYEADKPVMIAGPVAFEGGNRFVHLFQTLDFLSMQGITASVHALKMGNMCNGANLAFSKEAFYHVGGYSGVDHLASGDDYLLMMKMRLQYPGKIAYIKAAEAIITTPPQPNWRSFMQQRIRWASKTGKYDDKYVTSMLALVYLFNLSILVLTCIPGYINYALCMLGLKMLSEGIFLIPVSSFFHRQRLMWWFPVFQPFHIVYVLSAGLLGLTGHYQWKERTVK
jgi:cellulose synthase/poly-beta-1,6-N-acetylglucosamine synthase-like glycosyltransferase